jgi:hypothetical protein
VPSDSICNIETESGKYRWGVFRGFIVRAMAGSAAGIVTAANGGRRDRRSNSVRGPLAALLAAVSLAACSTGGVPSGGPLVQPTDIAYRLPGPAKPHFALSEIASLTSCVLDVFLYPEDGGLKVVHATTRDRVKLGTPDNSCTPFPDQRSASAQ